ncbi:MAG: hypothetical protein DRJ42_19425 [Deltaproteobacteria bacterium]|nr:MAG: hypothetical protein DRJ42_19425 [Deltaproteobacteria bacterium]
MRALTHTLLVLAGLWLAGAPQAAAQAGSAGERAAAQELLDHGLEASRDGRWTEALENFEQSYALTNENATLVNVADAQAATGQLMAAIASYERFLERARRRDARLVPGAQEALAEVRARLPRVVIRVEGLRGGDEVWLDDGILDHGDLDTPRAIDPGDHTVTIARGGASAAEESFHVAEGGDSEVLVDANPRERAAPDPRLAPDPGPGEPADDGGGSVLTSPWLWIGVGLVVAAAIVIPVAATSGGSTPAETYTGSLGAGVLTFR